MQELIGAVAKIERGQSQIATDAVLLVHYGITDADFRQIAQHRVDVAAAPFALAGPPRDVGIKLSFGDEGEICLGPDKAAMQRADRQCRARIAGEKCGPVFDQGWLEPVFGEILLHGFAAAETLANNEHALASGGRKALQ